MDYGRTNATQLNEDFLPFSLGQRFAAATVTGPLEPPCSHEDHIELSRQGTTDMDTYCAHAFAFVRLGASVTERIELGSRGFLLVKERYCTFGTRDDAAVLVRVWR